MFPIDKKWNENHEFFFTDKLYVINLSILKYFPYFASILKILIDQHNVFTANFNVALEETINLIFQSIKYLKPHWSATHVINPLGWWISETWLKRAHSESLVIFIS